MIPNSYPDDSVDSSAIENLNKGVWICYFSNDGSGLGRIHSALIELSNGELSRLSPWGPAFASVGDGDGLMMFFDGPKGGIIAFASFTDRGNVTLNEVIQKFMDPGTRFSEDGLLRGPDLHGLRATPVIEGSVEHSFLGSPILEYIAQSHVVDYSEHAVQGT